MQLLGTEADALRRSACNLAGAQVRMILPKSPPDIEPEWKLGQGRDWPAWVGRCDLVRAHGPEPKGRRGISPSCSVSCDIMSDGAPERGHAGSRSGAMSSIFISYRRAGTSGYGGRLQEDLCHHFGRDRVFRDIDSIRPGSDFTEVIEQAVARSGIVLVLIGENWLQAANKNGKRRLDDPDDFVRLEIEAALDQGIVVVPVLVENARVPSPGELPESLIPLGRRQGIELTDERWDYDLSRLVRVMSSKKSSIRRRRLQSIRSRPGRPRRRQRRAPWPTRPTRLVSAGRRGRRVAPGHQQRHMGMRRRQPPGLFVCFEPAGSSPPLWCRSWSS